MQERLSILTVDDDPTILKLERGILERNGYHVMAAGDGAEAVRAVTDAPPALVLLDVNMPGMDGFATCRALRTFSQVPIIVVTGKGSEQDKVRGLEAGADDYVTKPFFSDELIARVRAVLRRTRPLEEPQRNQPVFRIRDMVVDFAHDSVAVGGKDVQLTSTERKLLYVFISNAGRVLTADQVLAQVWGDDYVGEAHLLRVTIGRLRQKLGDDSKEPKYIATRTGMGYVLERTDS